MLPTSGGAPSKPFLRAFSSLDGSPEGAMSPDGRVHGSYLHGLFASDAFRRAFLAQLDIPAANQNYRARVESALDGAHYFDTFAVFRV